MGQFSLVHILLVLVIVLIFFGPKKLPELGKSLGQAIRGFRKAMSSVEEIKDELTDQKQTQLSQQPSEKESKKS